MKETQEIPENPISETLESVLAQLSTDQLRFVSVMQHCVTKKEAAAAISVSIDTVYRWPAIVDTALNLIALDRESAAREMGKKYLLRAMMVKAKGLESDDEVLRQRVATEIIEWNLGKATQKQELTGPNGEAVPMAIQFIPYGRTDTDNS